MIQSMHRTYLIATSELTAVEAGVYQGIRCATTVI